MHEIDRLITAIEADLDRTYRRVRIIAAILILDVFTAAYDLGAFGLLSFSTIIMALAAAFTARSFIAMKTAAAIQEKCRADLKRIKGRHLRENG